MCIRDSFNRGGYGNQFGKDDEDEDEKRFPRKRVPSKPKVDAGAVQPDKTRTAERVALEKKVVKKKSSTCNEKKKARPQPKQKRQAHKNFTKAYLEGEYDDYEDYDEDDWN